MTQEAAFDLSRKGFESWPFMFGSMYHKVFETAANGIESAIPQVHLLATWCMPFFDPEQKEALRRIRPNALDWTEVHEILDACLEVAQAKGAWEFKRETYEESTFAPS